jgi:hypothetical protein
MRFFFPKRVYAWQALGRTEGWPLALRAWQLRQYVRLEQYASWSLSAFLRRVGVRRLGLALFALPAVALALRGISGVGADVENYLWGLGLAALFGIGAGVISAALLWQYVQALVAFAKLYRERRMEFDRLLRSPDGVEGWHVVLTPEGEWQYEQLETGEGAA